MKFQFVIIVSLLMPIILKGQSIESKPVILCGKIENYNEFKEQKTMRLIYSNNLHILNQTSEVCTIDDDGGFKFAFSRNMPQDVMIDFVTTFSIFVCPGDSIYFEFKASKNRVEIYESLEFHGDGVHNNNVIADFNKFYFKNRPPFDLIRDQQTNLSPQKYISFMENIRGDLLQYAEKFIGENSVSDTAKEWINAAIQMYYLNGLAEYPDKHLRYNKLNKGDWFVDDDYFDPIINCNVNETMLCNTDVSSIFVNRYHHNCINYLNQKHLFQKGKGEFKKEGKYDVFVTNSVNISFGSGYKQAEKEIKPILKYTKDNIMRQLIIREYFYENIASKGFDTYFNTDRKRVFDKYVTIPLIKQQFFDYYSSANTNVDSEKSRGIKSALFDDIINKHKGKIIYIDCWGTWCAPCLSEIPYSNRLIGKYKSKDIVFVFICIDSPEDQWQLTVNKRGILGEHYWFDKDKSNQLRADYQIAGIPYYMLIDRNGQIVKEGNNLKPSQQDTDELIEKLLPEN